MTTNKQQQKRSPLTTFFRSKLQPINGKERKKIWTLVILFHIIIRFFFQTYQKVLNAKNKEKFHTVNEKYSLLHCNNRDREKQKKRI